MRPSTRMRGIKLIGQWLLLAAAVGCAQGPYQYGQFSQGADGPEKVAIERGGPHKVLDRMSDTLSWPRRKLFPNQPDRRDITPETLQQVTEYLEKNDLEDVHVSVRDYRPRQQWQRLRESRVVPPLARYTFGSLSVVGYTLLPGIVLDQNAYNPYTNTLNVNADAATLLMHEAAYAKNIRQRKLPGAYAVSGEVPFLNAWHEMDGAREVVGYAQAEEDWELEQEAYEKIYPKVGSEAVAGAAGMFLPVWWAAPAVSLAGGVAGGAAGKAALARREAERQETQTELVEREVLGREIQQASFEEPAKATKGRRYVTPSEHREPKGKE